MEMRNMMNLTEAFLTMRSTQVMQATMRTNQMSGTTPTLISKPACTKANLSLSLEVAAQKSFCLQPL
jgi:hypothetical protein